MSPSPPPASPHPLDNAVWHALHGPQRKHSQGGRAAKRFHPEIAPFAALPDEPSSTDWTELADLVGPGGIAVLFRADVEIPAGWELKLRFGGVQMIDEVPQAPIDDVEAQDLGPHDVADMLALVARTGPGPFGERTIELGRYIGVRRSGQLIAMAGQRLRLPGYVEISAVCTDTGHRAQGVASRLVRTLVADIQAGGDMPILHALDSNVAAIEIYESLGFAVRRAFDGFVLEAPS